MSEQVKAEAGEADVAADARHLLSGDGLARRLGIELVDVGEGRARAQLTIGDMHKNGAGIVHGGTFFALADFAFAAASNSRGQVALAIEAHISFLAPVREGLLVAEAREVSLAPRLATYAIEVRDGSGRLAAAFQGTVYRKKASVREFLAGASAGKQA